MYDVCHPVYYRICELGCKDDVKITTAFHVYIELCEERKLWDVDYKYDSTLDLIYLEAKKKQNLKADIYVPWAVKNNLKLDIIHEIQKQLNIQCFTLVLRNGDGTILFYTVNSGLKKSLSPQERLESRSKNDIKKELNRELRKNSRNLFEMAKLRVGDPGNHNDK